jgi:proteasome accessory factor A
MFDRLVGLETEYVLRFLPHQSEGQRPWNEFLFERLLDHLQGRIPLARSTVGQKSWFLVNGGGLRFESLPFYDPLPASGFVEGATPECRGPRQVLLYQRAQDVLLSQHAAASGGDDGDVALLKSSHDGQGHLFGCHENYEATIASGTALLFWRVALALTLPLLFFLFLFADIASLLLIIVLLAPVRGWHERRGRELGAFYVACVAWLVYLCRAPVQLVGSTLVWVLAFRRIRRQLLPFLITRTIFSGPGMVCPDGRFILSPRAAGLHRLCSVTAAGGRSVFYFCQILKGINEFMLGDWPSFCRLFHGRQRLQLTIADSNMAQFAEYLKIGTTLLVLDAIEAGELRHVPRLRRPLRALRTISADPELRTTLPLAGGSRASALEIQRFYLNACRRFLDRRDAANAEAREVLARWEETLDALEEDPARLVGKLDWVTKKHINDSPGEDITVEEKRKLDMRYHELSRDGYYVRLEAAGAAPTIVEPEDVLAAMTTPPEGTPASERGRLIREYRWAKVVRASWASVIVSTDSGTRCIRLS